MNHAFSAVLGGTLSHKCWNSISLTLNFQQISVYPVLAGLKPMTRRWYIHFSQQNQHDFNYILNICRIYSDLYSSHFPEKRLLVPNGDQYRKSQLIKISRTRDCISPNCCKKAACWFPVVHPQNNHKETY